MVDVDGKSVGIYVADGKLDGAVIGDAVSVINGKVVDSSIGFAVGNWLHVVLNVVDTAIGSSVIIF